eukprot:gene28591-34515_t
MAQVAEAQARLNVNLREIVQFFADAGVNDRSVNLLNSFIDKHLTMDFLSLAEGFGKCMAFLDHDDLISRLFKAYQCLIDGYIAERKLLSKRIRLLKEDKKADPDVLARQENALVEVDNKKAVAIVGLARLRAMNMVPLDGFKRDPKFNPMPVYKAALEQQRPSTGKSKK